MDVLTAAELRSAEQRTIAGTGIPARVLMENAGRAVARELGVRGFLGDRRRVLLLCGGGGNGGDGLVALRTLRAEGVEAAAILLSERDPRHPDTRANLDAALSLGLPVTRVRSESDWRAALDRTTTEPALPPSEWVLVDAILGSGAGGPLRGLPALAARDLADAARFRAPVRRVAVDLPTGLDPDTGAVPGPFLPAALTLALAAPRPCHFVSPAAEACGEVVVAEIGIPADFLRSGLRPDDGSTAPPLRLLDDAAVAPAFPPRPPAARKHRLGRLLLVAGSRRMPGAAALAAAGALRAGVGLLTVASTREALDALPPEAMRLPLPAGPEGKIAAEAADEVREFVAREAPDALALGPGLGRGEAVSSFVRRLVAETGTPLVLDADGLAPYAGRAADLASRPRLALTPHPGEAARLLGESAAEVQRDRLAAARRLAAVSGAAAALKGRGAIVAEPDGTVSLNRTGGSELAGGGTGDVLTGITGALLARGVTPARALAAAAFALGRAGAEARRLRGEESVTASEAASWLGAAIRGIREKAGPRSREEPRR